MASLLLCPEDRTDSSFPCISRFGVVRGALICCVGSSYNTSFEIKGK
jgi:hypothetical protein